MNFLVLAGLIAKLLPSKKVAEKNPIKGDVLFKKLVGWYMSTKLFFKSIRGGVLSRLINEVAVPNILGNGLGVGVVA